MSFTIFVIYHYTEDSFGIMINDRKLHLPMYKVHMKYQAWSLSRYSLDIVIVSFVVIMDAAGDNVESGFSEEETYSKNKQVDRKIPQDSEKSNKQPEMLYAAVRLYIEKGRKVNVVSTNKIQDFDSTINTFPYDAFVENGINEDEEIVYEPAAILAISSKYLKEIIVDKLT